MDKVDAFVSRFDYEAGLPGLDGWRYIKRRAVGDCDDFALTVAIIVSGDWWGFLWRLLTFQVWFWYVKSPANKLLPRHVAVWVRGEGWIDSTKRKWRSKPDPHKKRIPVPWPLVLIWIVIGFVSSIPGALGRLFR